MVAMKDIAGQRFGRLFVVERVASTADGRTQWRCRCECGGETVQPGVVLRKGLVRSCGCLRREMTKRMGQATFKHGHAVRVTTEYRIWRGTLERCHNPNGSAYRNYGARGIFVCDEWRTDFQAFYRDMGPRPSRRHSLDRINNDGPYSRDNCRWATLTEQNNNRRDNHIVVVDGQSMTLADAIRTSSTTMKPKTVRERVRSGLPIERALYDGHKRKRVEQKG